VPLPEGAEPYEVGRVVSLPGTQPYVLHITLSPEGLEAVGVLEQITDVFASAGVPILQLKVSGHQRGRPIKVVVIADLRGRERRLEELVQSLRRVPYVEGVRWAPPVAEGVAVDTLSFPLTSHGLRCVVLTEPVYRGWILEGWRRFGTAYAILLYSVGYEAGRRAYAEHVKVVPEPNTWRFASALFQLRGLGRIETLRLDDAGRSAVIRVYDSFECSLFPNAGEIRGNFVRGMIAGWLAAHWGLGEGEEAFAREERCIAKGDPYCEFHVRVERSRG